MFACDVLCPAAKGEAQEVELFLCCGKEEIALILAMVDGAFEFGVAVFIYISFDVVACCHAIRAEVVGDLQQVTEFDALVTAHAGDGGFSAQVAVGEIINDGFAEVALVVQDVVGEAQLVRDLFGVVDVLSRAAGLALDDAAREVGLAHIVKLQGDADDIVAFLMQERGHDGRIHAAGHGNDHAGVARGFCNAETV